MSKIRDAVQLFARPLKLPLRILVWKELLHTTGMVAFTMKRSKPLALAQQPNRIRTSVCNADPESLPKSSESMGYLSLALEISEVNPYSANGRTMLCTSVQRPRAVSVRRAKKRAIVSLRRNRSGKDRCWRRWTVTAGFRKDVSHGKDCDYSKLYTIHTQTLSMPTFSSCRHVF